MTLTTSLPDEGSIVAVAFWDHIHNSDTPVHCKVFGVLHKIRPTFITVDAWVPTDEDEHPRSAGNNTECFTIMRCCLTACIELGEIE